MIRTVTVGRKKKLQIGGPEPFKQNDNCKLEKSRCKTNRIINYFPDRQDKEKILKDKEYFTAISCKYCKICLKWQKFYSYSSEFKKKGFWTINKDVKYWDVYDPDRSYRNEIFSLKPLKGRYRM